MTQYSEFLKGKIERAKPVGFDVDPGDIHPMLFDWQRDVVRWACMRGRAALFEECGLGKTLQQIEWARLVSRHTNGGKVLILAPLAVAHQTVAEGRKIGVDVRYVRSQAEVDAAGTPIIITNYDMIHHFDASQFAGVVLDESSILKAFTGSIKRKLVEMFSNTPYRLACTATPAPNDHLEFGNHSEFLGIMPGNRMISRWFINNTMGAGDYRLKKHAADDFWRWMVSWSVCISKPSDLGDYDDNGFIIPPLHIHSSVVEVDHTRAFADGQLFVIEALSATGMWKEKRETEVDRVNAATAIIGDSDDFWVIWCDTNSEADLLVKLFPDAVEVRGSDSIAEKERKLTLFSDGLVKKIITKPEIAGFGLNWQHCANMVFVGVTYSFEKTYQAMRRTWRFGQLNEVNAYMIYAETEGNIVEILGVKQVKHEEMLRQMSIASKAEGLDGIFHRHTSDIAVETDIAQGDNWTMLLGDSCQTIDQIPDNSLDFSIFSPPFSTLYIYTDTPADMGKNEDHEQFFAHFRFLIDKLWAKIKPGRLIAVHCKDLPLYMNRDGAAGLYDFPGRLIAEFEKERYGSKYRRWAFHSRVTIWKDPVIEMQRTKNHGLLWKNYSVRGEVARQGMPDYVIVFRKWVEVQDMPDKQVQNAPAPGTYIGEDGPKHWDTDRDYSIQTWQKYASPVWFDIRQTNVLNVREARDKDDEKHICPLQLDVIERCIDLWTNPGDVVHSPFAGIGSEGYIALKLGRKFIGQELKRSYFDSACGYLRDIEKELSAVDLFTWAAQEAEVEVDA